MKKAKKPGSLVAGPRFLFRFRVKEMGKGSQGRFVVGVFNGKIVDILIKVFWSLSIIGTEGDNMEIPEQYRGLEQAFVKHNILESYLERLFMIVGKHHNEALNI